MARNYTHSLTQLQIAKQNALTAIAGWEKASETDGADRSGTIASAKRDIVQYDRQLAEIEKLMTPEPAPIPAEKPPQPTK